MQVLLDSVVAELQSSWGSLVRHNPPIMPDRENCDRLGYDPGNITRARR
ncbi:hypothetical protein IU438_13320 [Nocardia cyriacigeorgica]|nr:hypothetical protein [Nocardia cyriacigeorgica]MBF6088486.1 hypothetical protein [Nocardia cyriacigeorgica]MBF6095591.1 hypothetical protein [Nocardia cyriacigeorgica]MBF6396773.1 hypothetical protein [Nocardia cyriacigeorgica]MBF6402405.1 hypothetical protein [Nocardia cyriacigeorgica]